MSMQLILGEWKVSWDALNAGVIYLMCHGMNMAGPWG